MSRSQGSVDAATGAATGAALGVATTTLPDVSIIVMPETDMAPTLSPNSVSRSVRNELLSSCA